MMAEENSEEVPAEPRVTGTGNMENQMDEDYLFFLSLTKKYFTNLVEHSDIDLCQAWLNKLCAEKYCGLDAKRFRNIYLSHLILAMQEGQVFAPFELPPPEGPLKDPNGMFGPPQPDIAFEDPDWLREVRESEDEIDFEHHSRNGRVYLASKSLEDGQGAFAYLAVSLAKENDAGDGYASSPYQEHSFNSSRISEQGSPSRRPRSADENELSAHLKESLSKRATRPERKRLMRFYEDMILSATDELQGRGKANRNAEKLIATLSSNSNGSPVDRRAALESVIEKVKKRMQDVKMRGEILDRLEEKIRGATTEDEKIMEQSWQSMCQSDFTKSHMEKLNSLYPSCVVVRFLDLLREERREMVSQHGKRYEEYQEECDKEMANVIKEKIDEYNQVEKEWEVLCPMVTALKKARHEYTIEQQRREKVKEDRAKFNDQSSAESCKHLEALLEEINKAKAALQAETNQSTVLTNRIEDMNSKVQRIATSFRLSQETDANEHKRLREEIDALRAVHRDQLRRIAQLEEMAKGH